MLRIAKKLIALVSLSFFLLNTNLDLNSQVVVKNDKPLEANFYQLQNEFKDYWSNKDNTQKGKGWKQFKRWEWFWGQRLYPSGEFKNPMAAYEAHRTVTTKKYKTDGIQAVGDWVSLGPTSSSGGYAGIGRINCVRENPSNSSILYAGAAAGGFWISTNGGTSWATTTDEIGSLGVTDIAVDPNNSSNIFIATGDADAGDTYSVGILKSTDGGSTWNTTGLNWTTNNTRTISRIIIHPTNSSIMYAATSNGVYKTTDGGSNWTQVYANAVKDLEMNPSDPTMLFASRTTVVRTTDAGSTWSTASGLPASGVYRAAIAVTPANSAYVYAFFCNNSNYGFYGLYRSTNSGASFTQMSTTPNILGWNTTGNDAGGQGWYDLALAVSPSDANLIFTGGINIWKSTNGGTNWTNLSNWTSSVHADQHDIWVVPGTTRMYAGNDGGVYKSTNAGTNWTWIGNGIKATQFYRIGGSATNSSLVIAGAQDNGTKLRNGSTWTDVIGGDGMECIISHSNSNIQYGELYYGAIKKSTNGGTSFSAMTLPSEQATYGAWVTPYIMHPSDANLMFLGYKNVFKTTNGGTAWTQISNFASGSLTLLHAAPSNANYIYAGTGSVLSKTTNGGTTWTSINLPSGNYNTYLAIHPTDPLKIWATFSGYSSGQKVYYSTDGGTSWTNVSGALPNVPCNTIVFQKDYYNRVYVGTDVGVYYKDDNNAAWQDFNTSLPNVVINELEIHEGSSRLRAATYGRGLWEAEIPVISLTLDAPVLSAPTNNATGVAIAPTLSWGAVTNALSYTIQYSTDNTFATNTATTSSTTSKSISGLNYNATYYWRAKAVNGNVNSTWSSTFTFTTLQLTLSAPTLSSPANSATGVAIAPTLSWGAVTNATGYTIQYSTDNTFATKTEVTSATASKSLSGLNLNTTYYWRAKATNGNVNSAWSSTFAFTTLQLSLNAPTLSSPANSATNVSIAPTFSWGTVTNATGYTIQYSSDNTFATNTEVTSSTTTKAISGLSYITVYYWRVKATNGGISSAWSTTRSFTTSQLTLSKPTLITPTNGASNRTRNNLAFAWSAITNATGYTLQISTTSSFSTLFGTYTTTTNADTISGLGSQIRYYWRVKATNGGTSSSWSSTRYFTTGRTREIEDNSEIGINPIVNNSIYIAPNPLTSRSEISITTADGTTNHLALYNLLGLKVKEFQIPSGAVNVQFELNRENLPVGVYMLVLSNSEGNVSELLFIE